MNECECTMNECECTMNECECAMNECQCAMNECQCTMNEYDGTARVVFRLVVEAVTTKQCKHLCSRMYTQKSIVQF